VITKEFDEVEKQIGIKESRQHKQLKIM